MRLVLTVVAPAEHARAAAGAFDALRAELSNAGPPRPLADGPWFAIETEFDGSTPAARVQAERLRGIATLDVAVTPALGRRKRVLVADMDSTILATESLDELAAAAGVGEAVARITERAMAGALDFEGALRARVALLAGHPARLIDDVLADGLRFNPGAKSLVRTMRQAGARTALVSGGFTPFVARAAAEAGFDAFAANVLQIEDAVLTGAVGEPILGRAAKREALEREAEAIGASLAETLGIGDGANDLALIEAAGLGIGYRPKPALAAVADARIEVCDLTAALFFQGYAADEITAAP